MTFVQILSKKRGLGIPETVSEIFWKFIYFILFTLIHKVIKEKEIEYMNIHFIFDKRGGQHVLRFLICAFHLEKSLSNIYAQIRVFRNKRRLVIFGREVC